MGYNAHSGNGSPSFASQGRDPVDLGIGKARAEGQPVRNGKAIGDVVGLISEWTWERWGVYLSAIVVHKNTSYPGGWIFRTAGDSSEIGSGRSWVEGSEINGG